MLNRWCRAFAMYAVAALGIAAAAATAATSGRLGCGNFAGGYGSGNGTATVA